MGKNNTPEINTTNAKEPQALPGMASYEAIAMGGPALNAIIDMPGLKLCFVNSQFGHYLGYTNQDIQTGAINMATLLGNHGLERFLFQLNNVKNSITAQSHSVTYQLKNKNGETGPYHLYAAPACNSKGETDNGKYHLTLLPELSKWDIPFTSFNTKELFFEYFSSEDSGSFEWIIDTGSIYCSGGICRIYEMNNMPLHINNLFDKMFIHPSDRERMEQETKEAIASGSGLDTNYKIITANQNTKMIHCIARTVKGQQGASAIFAGVMRDVTRQRAIETDLENKIKELNHSNAELEEFAYVASHDLQEPLRKITTFSDRLLEKYQDALTGNGTMYLSRMVVAAENMRTLINDLLEFSRISKTSQPFEQVNLNFILRQVKTELDRAIKETNCVINSVELPSVVAISSQMKQLLVNIIGNAIKFHKADLPPAIAITASELTANEQVDFRLLKGRTYYKIQVTDNGIGFEEEYATRIFEVFQRLHGKSEYPGSGIGLAICKKIIDHHQGIIYAENIPDTGARFTFILPQSRQ